METSGPTADWHAEYVIALQQATPYPAHNNAPTPSKTYMITLVVTPASPQEPASTPTARAATPIPTSPDRPAPALCQPARPEAAAGRRQQRQPSPTYAACIRRDPV
jgi:hypothetical protein